MFEKNHHRANLVKVAAHMVPWRLPKYNGVIVKCQDIDDPSLTVKRAKTSITLGVDAI
jgi:hypothetical protein